jgi:hypothetical protein
MKNLCKIFRSSRHEGMYLYVDFKQGLESVPPELMRRFGKPVEAMTLVLKPERRLARADVVEVIAAIERDGFYLQMPPSVVNDMQRLATANDKLPL